MYSQLEYILKSIKKYPVHTLEVLPCGKLKLETKVREDFTIFKNLCKLGLVFVFDFQAGEGPREILQPLVSSSSGKLKLISHRINIFPQITIFCEINTHPLQLGGAGASYQAPAPFYAGTN